MKKTMIALSMAALFGATSSATAMDFDPANFYYGGGLTMTDVDGADDAANGFQFFAGIPLDLDLGEVKSAVEVGFRDLGEADFTVCQTFPFVGTVCGTGTADLGSGLFVDYVAAYPASDQFNVLGIIGADFNSDAEMIEYGIGGEFAVNDNFGARVTYMFKEADGGGDASLIGLTVTYKQ